MKKLTLILLIVLIVLLGTVMTWYFGGRLSVHLAIQTAPASEYPAAYEQIRALIAAGNAPQAFDAAPPEDPSGYTLADITLRLNNRGLFPAEWLSVSVAPIPGDVAVYALTGEGSDVPPRGEGKVNLKLITTAPADALRDITLQYYVYGMKREITVQ